MPRKKKFDYETPPAKDAAPLPVEGEVPVYRYIGRCEAGHVTFAAHHNGRPYELTFPTGKDVSVPHPDLAKKLATNNHFERVS